MKRPYGMFDKRRLGGTVRFWVSVGESFQYNKRKKEENGFETGNRLSKVRAHAGALAAQRVCGSCIGFVFDFDLFESSVFMAQGHGVFVRYARLYQRVSASDEIFA